MPLITHKEMVALQALTVAACSLGVSGRRDTSFLVNHGAAALESGKISNRELAMFLACAGCRLYAPFFSGFRTAVQSAIERQDEEALLRCMRDCGKMLPELYENAALTSAQVAAVDNILQQEYEARSAFILHLERYSDLIHLKKGTCYTSLCSSCTSERYLAGDDPVFGAMLAACGTPSVVRVPDYEPSTSSTHIYSFDYVKLVRLLADDAPNPNTGQPFARAGEMRALYSTQISMARYS